MVRIIRFFIILIEGVHQLWVLRDRRRFFPGLPTKEYLWWRLGTVYGLQPPGENGYPDGNLPPKTFEELVQQAWRDREQICRYLLWRRRMRIGYL